jgi:NAD(P)-dependent dehydrogenase (short-subunit alcohol dehydrogenase family)
MKNIIITGAAGQLGKVVVTEFLGGDYHLHLLVTRDMPVVDRETVYVTDLTDPGAVQRLAGDIAAATAKIDAVVHLVGAFTPGTLDAISVDDIDKMIRVNFITGFNLVKAFLPHFRAAQAGRFVFIGARAAMHPATAGANVAYALSKQMVNQLVHLINEAEGSDRISAHVLLPGTLDTPLNRQAMPDADFTQWTSSQRLAGTIRRIVEGTDNGTVIDL